MRWRPFTWALLSVACFLGALYFWRLGNQWEAERKSAAGANQPTAPANATTSKLAAAKSAAAAAINPDRSSNWLAHRLSNTTKTVSELAQSENAILLENALIDTERPANLPIPEHLRAKEDPGTYLVQGRGPLDDAFRTSVSAAGGQIIAYVPNNAYLVRVSGDGAEQLRGGSQSVLRYEPYYKLKADLLSLAAENQSLSEESTLNVLLFDDARESTVAALQQAGVEILSEDGSPFGTVLHVRPPLDSLPALAQLPGVQVIERFYPRFFANDLSRARLNVSSNTTTALNYLDLTGSGVTVAVNDSGVRFTHLDFATNRVFGDTPAALNDTVGHGTHVAGIIAGNGSQSITVTNAPGSLLPASTNQFRGKAPAANVFSVSIAAGPSDQYIQQVAASSNVFIANNSWNYGSVSYNLSAASYDAAVRDALPEKTGSTPMLLIFSAGNGANAPANDGGGGLGDSILAPATAKNVITVGSIEQLRNITNEVEKVENGLTNVSTPWQILTDSSNQVAGISSRGNVGIGIEGEFGRFKPDVVAPGAFVIAPKSDQWDQAAYFNPTNTDVFIVPNLFVQTNSLYIDLAFISQNTVGYTIEVFGVQPPADLPIYLTENGLPTLDDTPAGTNLVSVPISFQDTVWGFAVGNSTTQSVTFNLRVTQVVTNEEGNKLTVLSNLNASLGPAYRFESGTSMAAADVTGVLALMTEFFNRLSITSSPALMKALLLNGSRSAGDNYYFQVNNTINYQGWGVPSLRNSLPTILTNGLNPAQAPLYLFDQSPQTALSTGQKTTRTFALTPAARNQPLRVTLAWTDPPGSPAVGIKLVNDLDLVVTNLETGQVFFGNDIRALRKFNLAWDTNSVPRRDFVNNVENVYLENPLGTNYSVTVIGRRVNVNAVNANTNSVVQDYALVVSSGNGDLANALTLNPITVSNVVSTPDNIVFITNTVFGAAADTAGSVLLNQRVGGNRPFPGTNSLTVPNGAMDIGISNQWNFYIITNINDATFTNAAFATFAPPNLSPSTMGVYEDFLGNATRDEADIDMFVSRGDAGLLTLNPVSLANARKSLGRNGTESLVYSDAQPNEIFYIAIKSEDQRGAEYGFLGLFSELPFSSEDQSGNQILRGVPVPAVIPDASTTAGGTVKGGFTTVFGIAAEPVKVRRAIVTNTLSHELVGDLITTLSHDGTTIVLNNHTCIIDPSSASCFTNFTYIYEDNGEGNVLNSKNSDGPGSLRDFIGAEGVGVWMLTAVDSLVNHTGQVDTLSIRLEPQQDTNGVELTVQSQSFVFTFIDVPADATNLTVCVANESVSQLPVQLYLRRNGLPSQTVFDHTLTINPPGPECLSVGLSDLPPLRPGRYFIGVFNPNGIAQQVRITATVQVDPNGVLQTGFGSDGSTPLIDDAVTRSTIFVNENRIITSADVAVRIEHARVSDLVLTLISPSGERFLLAENRGGSSGQGMGAGVQITNVFPTTVSGGPNADTNLLSTGGSLTINYNFFNVPDLIRVYYDGILRYDSGYVSNSGSIAVPGAPAVSTIMITMNEGGNTNATTAWTYTATVLTKSAAYLTFTENTNRTLTPIKHKFPLGDTNATLPVAIGNFEVAPGTYTATTNVDNWTVASNTVSVATDLVNAFDFSNYLALASGLISRSIPTTPGRSYVLSYSFRGPGIVSWWRGENNTFDAMNLNPGVIVGPVGYTNGMVGNAFSFNGNPSYVLVSNSPSLSLTEGISIEMWYNENGSSQSPTYGLLAKRFSSSPVNYGINVTPGDLGIGVNVYYNFPFQQNIPVTVPSIANFHHIVATYQQRQGFVEVNTYIDGVLARGPTAFGPSLASSVNIHPVTFGRTSSEGEQFRGLIDEPSLYGRALSAAEVSAIYQRGSVGKFNPSLIGFAPGESLAEARVTLGSSPPEVINGRNTNWTTRTLSFAASQSNVLMTIEGLQPGMLLDGFSLFQVPDDTYVLPETSLNALIGQNAFGEWTLEILDNRTGAPVNANLVNWQLRFVFESIAPNAISLFHGVAVTNTVPPGQIAYFSVDVPPWASFATNILISSSQPVNLLFNQNTPPISGDFALLTASVGGIGTPILDLTTTPPLMPGRRYYLGVENLNVTAADVVIRVDFDVTALTDAVPVTSILTASVPTRYFSFEVSSNAFAAAFRLFNMAGNLDLVARKGLPLPTLQSLDYGSFNPGTANEDIIVITNSVPVPLTPGTWFLGVFNRDAVDIAYTIVATETVPVIPLTNAVPLDYVATTGPIPLNYFSFDIATSNAPAVLFEVYNMTGDVNLIVQRDQLPINPPFFASSFSAGLEPEQIVLRTNPALLDLNSIWYLGVPNMEFTNVNFTIRAMVPTNGMLISGQPIQVVIGPPSATSGPPLRWNSVDGEHYQIQVSPDLFVWSVFTTVTASGKAHIFVDPNPVIGVPARFYRVIQVP